MLETGVNPSISSYLAFEPDGSSLVTDVGAFLMDGTVCMDTNHSSAGEMISYRSGISISKDICWVTWNKNNLL